MSALAKYEKKWTLHRACEITSFVLAVLLAKGSNTLNIMWKSRQNVPVKSQYCRSYFYLISGMQMTGTAALQ